MSGGKREWREQGWEERRREEELCEGIEKRSEREGKGGLNGGKREEVVEGIL